MSMIINSYQFGVAYTARTTAFLAATGISDTTIANALNAMDLALIANGLDTKMQALYPMVGGTATTHKYNFMNPADTDAAFRLTFSGGWTHSSTGAKPNGSTGYANTFYVPNVSGTANNEHLSYYSRTNSNGTEVEIGTNAGANYSLLEIRTAGTSYYIMQQGAGYVTAADSNSQAFYIGTRTASNATAGYKNGSSVGTGSAASLSLGGYAIYIGGLNNAGSTAYFSTKECAFASIGLALTSGQASTYYSIVQDFNTSLSRNV